MKMSEPYGGKKGEYGVFVFCARYVDFDKPFTFPSLSFCIRKITM